MKSIAALIAAGSLVAALAIAQPERRSYIVADLGTFPGGNFSAGYGINNAGWVTGCSNLVPNGPQHPFIWYGAGLLIDLGSLGGPNACADVPLGPNGSGEATITSDTPNAYMNEDFCEDGTHLQCLGAVSKNGRLTALPTLPGGHNDKAFGLNNQGQVVGFSENGTSDPTCAMAIPSQKFQYEAAIWEPDGEIRQLSPLPDDTVGFAWGINENGEAVGASGLCSNTNQVNGTAAPHAVRWERGGRPTDLGHLPGVAPGVYNLATSINSRGEVVGFAQASDGTQHGFLWTEGTGMQDIGGFPGAVGGTGPICCHTINNSGEIVGASFDASFNSRALVWQDKTPVDLNTLIPADSPWYLQAAHSINDAGEIAGYALLKSSCPMTVNDPQPWVDNQFACTVVHAFLATPR